MIEAVQDRMYRNAQNLLTPQELIKLEEPEDVHIYVADSPDGMVTAVRMQHRLGRDGSGGGFKMMEVDSDLPIEERLRRNQQHALGLATLMTLKGNLVELDLPGGFGNDFGGAKGEMYVPRGTLVSPEKRAAIFREYVEKQYAAGALGLGIDRHAPDMNTGPWEMDAGADRLREIIGDDRGGAAFSGKSLENGGLEGREIATGLGMVYMLENHLQTLQRNPRGMTAAVMGSGNVGYHFAKLAKELLGVEIMGISDRDRAVVGDSNRPLQLDDSIKFENRSIGWWDEDKHRQLAHPDDLLEAEVDIFVFAAAPDVVTAEKGNIGRLKAGIILEGANSPLDNTATDYYMAEGKDIIPDILANGAGYVMSNFEYNQGQTRHKWEKSLAIATLHQVMNIAYENVHNTGVDLGDERNLKDAAFSHALKRQWEKDNGIYVPMRGGSSVRVR